MRNYAPTLFIVLGILASHASGNEKELAKLKGSWSTVTVEHDGKDYSDKYKFRMVFKGDQATIEGNDSVKKAYATLKFKLDPSAKPAIVDLSVAAGAQQNVVFEGIYEVKGDQFKMCVKVMGNERPSQFAAPAGSNNAYVVLKREP